MQQNIFQNFDSTISLLTVGAGTSTLLQLDSSILRVWVFHSCHTHTHTLQFFSAPKTLKNWIFSLADVSLNNLFNSIKFELSCLSRLKMVSEISSETRWQKKDNKLRMTRLFFIFLTKGAALEKTLYSRVLPNNFDNEMKKEIVYIHYLLTRDYILINITR